MKNPPGWKKNTETMPESPAEVLPLSPATWWQALRALAHEYHHEVVLVASLSALLLVASAIAHGDDRWKLFAPYRARWGGGPLGRAATQLEYWRLQLLDRIEEGRG